MVKSPKTDMFSELALKVKSKLLDQHDEKGDAPEKVLLNKLM